MYMYLITYQAHQSVYALLADFTRKEDGTRGLELVLFSIAAFSSNISPAEFRRFMPEVSKGPKGVIVKEKVGFKAMAARKPQ